MLRTIGAAIVSYIVFAMALFVFLTLAYFVLGADRAFQPGSYEATALWLVVSFALGLAASIVGGAVCALIAPNSKAPLGLAALVFVLGLLFAIPVLTSSDNKPQVREASVGNLEAMQNARQPGWVALLNPFLGAAGVMLGSRLKK